MDIASKFLRMFRSGFDTQEIATVTNQHEGLVCDLIHEARKNERAQDRYKRLQNEEREAREVGAWKERVAADSGEEKP